MTFAMRFFRGALNAIVWPLVELGSNRILLAGIVLITMLWMLQSAYAPHPWDDYRSGLPKLVLAYTIWFGLVEGATKVVQSEQQRRDKMMQEKMQRQSAVILKQNRAILSLSEAVRAALTRSEERDEDMRELLEELVDRIESGGIPEQVTNLAQQVRTRLAHEPLTRFHLLVGRLCDAILAEAP